VLPCDYTSPPSFYPLSLHDALPICINIVGLKRNGVTAEGIDALHEAHRLLYRAKMSVRHATEILESHGHMTPEVVRHVAMGFERSEEHTSELQSLTNLVCRLLLEKK